MNFDDKVNKSKEVLLNASKKWKKDEIFVAWTGGKDSTVILHLIRSVFKNTIPFKVFFNDSTIEFPQIYTFIKKLVKNWNIDLVHLKHLNEDLKAFEKAKHKEEKMEIMRLAKVNAINYAISKYRVKAFISGIRWDEHEARSHEKYFSKRLSHTRVHPILHFDLEDIWNYIKTFNVPYVDLYDKGYKSLGEMPFTKKAPSKDASERSGRDATKEKTMNRLRKLGYW